MEADTEIVLENESQAPAQVRHGLPLADRIRQVDFHPFNPSPHLRCDHELRLGFQCAAERSLQVDRTSTNGGYLHTGNAGPTLLAALPPLGAHQPVPDSAQ